MEIINGIDQDDICAGCDVIDDTSPQLGGNLDMGTHKLVGEGGSTGVYVDSTGSVGVGTTEPYSDLHIVGQVSLGNSVTTSNTGRALNLISTDAMVRVLRVHVSYGAGVEMMTRASADGADTARWDMTTNGATAGFTIRDRLGGEQDRIVILHDSGNVGISTTTPTTKLDVNSDILRLRTAKTPATAGADGNQGDIAWDADYIYVCTATNTWKRSGLSTW